MTQSIPQTPPSDVGFKIVSAWLQQEGTAARGDQLYTMNRFADFVLAHAPQPPAGQQPGYSKSQVKRLATHMGWEPKGGRPDHSPEAGDMIQGGQQDRGEARTWAWEQVREQVGTSGWTVGESSTFFGFFCWGWQYRGQLEKQPASPTRGMTPLTIEQIEAAYPPGITKHSFAAGVRWAEAAHGITTPPKNGDPRVSDKGVDQ